MGPKTWANKRAKMGPTRAPTKLGGTVVIVVVVVAMALRCDLAQYVWVLLSAYEKIRNP